MEPKQLPPYPLRMPQELREELEREAEAGKRSLNAEVVMRLELTLARQSEKRSELLARHRVVFRQCLDLEAQLMVGDEILITREARLNEQRTRNPSEKNLASFHEDVQQAERVVLGLKQVLAETQSRLRKVETELADIDGRTHTRSARDAAARDPKAKA